MADRDDEIRRLRLELEAARGEADRAKDEADRAKDEADRAKEHQRNTSYDEYLRICHEELFITLEVRGQLTLTGSGITNVTGKHYPLILRPWDGFLDEQRLCHDIITETISGFLLPSKLDVRAIARTSNTRPVHSEEDLRIFEYLAVEKPVENIMSVFGRRSQENPNGREVDCKAIWFENQPSSLTEPDDEDGDEVVSENVQGQPGSRKKRVLARRGLSRKRPDRWAICTRLSGQQCITFPCEYKAAHKIPVECFQEAMGEEDLFTRVILGVLSDKVSNEDETSLQGQKELLVAKALTQTFDYMVHLGTSYGYLTAGKSLVFLHVGDDPRVLYYYLSQPEADAKGPDGSIDPFHTGVAQLAAFCLQTCRDSGKLESWKERAILQLKKWPQPYDETCGATTEEESPQSTSSGSSYTPSITAAQDLTVVLRRRTRASCKPDLEPGTNDPSDDDSVGGSSRRIRGLQPSLVVELPAPKKQKDVTSESDEPGSSEVAELEARPYCTQECMLGLKRNGLLDEKCPNMTLHHRASRDMSHPIDAACLRELMQEELRRPVYRLRSIKRLDGDGKYGATGALFKLSSSDYGYTFVGKGTYAAAVERLQHEEEVYKRIEPLQGRFSPVCLGSITLDTPYMLPAADIVYMLLMSWAGDALTDDDDDDDDFLPEMPWVSELLQAGWLVGTEEYRKWLFRDLEALRFSWMYL
ncbi:hypothetical protein UVI_02008830 [Ustilaginoidea virens]|uniref:Metalloprotease m41 ftsh n=1 Tax=Ustilaginoidea virens TaxID=1159556 RepID=A0A1B5KUL3_USTVR|nr:hypothetical protein UVI_02008830 [Ustilaginoidea virens]